MCKVYLHLVEMNFTTVGLGKNCRHPTLEAGTMENLDANGECGEASGAGVRVLLCGAWR